MKQTNSKTTYTTKDIGVIGEQVALEYLLRNGYVFIEKNYWRKWGELDLIVSKNEIVTFVEVKSVSYETKEKLEYAVTHETWRPEEQVHQFKLHQMHKAIETWIAEQGYKGEWEISVLGIRIVPRETFASVSHVENVTM